MLSSYILVYSTKRRPVTCNTEHVVGVKLTQHVNEAEHTSSEKLSAERVKLVMEHIWRMQEFCNSMSKLSLDAYEYAYLKAIVLFSPGEGFSTWVKKIE